MKMTVRAKLTLGLLGLLTVGSLTSLGILAILSRSCSYRSRFLSGSEARNA